MRKTVGELDFGSSKAKQKDRLAALLCDVLTKASRRALLRTSELLVMSPHQVTPTVGANPITPSKGAGLPGCFSGFGTQFGSATSMCLCLRAF